MKRIYVGVFALLSSFAVLTPAAFGQAPAISPGGVLHGATFSPTGLPNSSIPLGGFFTIFGTNLGPATSPTLTLPIRTMLGGTSVTFVTGGTSTSALIFYASATQINGVLPSNAVTGSGNVTVTYNGATSGPEPVTAVTANFGAFTRNGAGTGPAALQDFTQNYQLNSLRSTTKPGDVAILYGTGLGPNPDGDQDANGAVPNAGGDLRTANNLDFHLYVGGVDATASVSYAGRSSFVGLDQINFTVPANVPTGCFVPVIVRIGTLISNSASMAIDPNGNTCSDPMGLTSSEIDSAATGNLRVGSLLLTRLGVTLSGLAATVYEDDAQARFYEIMGSNYLTSPENEPSIISLSSFGSCQVTTCFNSTQCVPSAQGLAFPKLDAGTLLNVSGNGMPSADIAKLTSGNNAGFYAGHLGSAPIQLPGYSLVNPNGTPPGYLIPGTYTFAGTGGTDVSAFSASIAIPPTTAFSWSSPQVATDGSATVTRGSDPGIQFNWTGGSSSDYVLMSVTSATNSGVQPSDEYSAATVTCLQPASAGTYTMPSWLLNALPASSAVNLGSITQPGGAVLVGTFNVTNTFANSSLDVALANSIVQSGVVATVK